MQINIKFNFKISFDPKIKTVITVLGIIIGAVANLIAIAKYFKI